MRRTKIDQITNKYISIFVNSLRVITGLNRNDALLELNMINTNEGKKKNTKIIYEQINK